MDFGSDDRILDLVLQIRAAVRRPGSHLHLKEGSTIEEQTADLPTEVGRAIELLFDRKAEDVVLLDLRTVSGATDFFLIATGRSDTHVSAIGDHLVEELKKEGLRPYGVEGMRGGRWVLVDYVDFVVHIFHPAAREFYQLERLWGDVPVRELIPQEKA